MAKSLPESIDLNTVVRKEWQLSGELLLSDLDRMPVELIASPDAPVKYEILFRQSETAIGEAIIRIEAGLQLVCQRSLETFEFPLSTNNTIGFIDNIEDEADLASDLSPSWVEQERLINPKVLLEDEVLLLIPDIPVKPGTEFNTDYLTTQDEDEPEAEQIQNPFAALEQLKNKN